MHMLIFGTVSPRALVILAALVWYIGGIVLLVKGSGLLFEAESLYPSQFWPWLSTLTGLSLGGVKSHYLFSHRCRQNLARIAALERPRIWQFFRPGFFVALALMILAGATLSRLAHGDYLFLQLVAIVDMSIGTALLGSSTVFWRYKPAAAVPPGQ